jgi:hypothetical protein
VTNHIENFLCTIFIQDAVGAEQLPAGLCEPTEAAAAAPPGQLRQLGEDAPQQEPPLGSRHLSAAAAVVRQSTLGDGGLAKVGAEMSIFTIFKNFVSLV